MSAQTLAERLRAEAISSVAFADVELRAAARDMAIAANADTPVRRLANAESFEAAASLAEEAKP